MKRNELDLILTELLPVEVSIMYTHTHFYDFLLNNEKTIKTIEKKLQKAKYSSTAVFDKDWHATPYKYLVNKGNNELREISLLNPFSVLEVLFFIKLYNREFLDTLSKKNFFSLRSHKKNTDLLYKDSKEGLVKYTDSTIKKDRFTKSLETSGIFYNLFPYSALGQFYSSKEWFTLNSRFKYFGKIDFQDCFGSIYTHSYKWTVSSNAIDSRSYKNNNLFSVIDRLLQQMNGSITNGIVVGPEFSRMAAELLLQQIDYEVYNTLIEKKIEKDKDYKVFRYVDDIYIFTNEEVYVNDIIALYKEVSLKYQLKLNNSKTKTGKLPYVWNEWKTETKEYVKHLNDKCFYKHDSSEEYLIKAKNFNRHKTVASIKEDFQNLLSKYPEKKEKIVSYVYSAFFNQLRTNKKKSLFRENINKKELENVFDFVFYLYSFAPTFRNTRKLISIDYLIEKDVTNDMFKDVFQKTVEEYDHIFLSSNLPDLVDLFPILRKKEIEISVLIEEHIWKTIYKSSNPILIANFLIYASYNTNYYESIKNQFEEKMLLDLSVIGNSKEILLQKGLWWLIIFNDYPDLSQHAKQTIIDKIEFLKRTGDEPNAIIQNLLYSFLTSVKYSNKFIEWDILNANLSEEIAYFTYERTIFKKESVESDFITY